MRNVTTPRTLAECQFVTGYTEARPMRRPMTIGGVLLACAIGIALGAALVYGWRV